MSDERPLHRPMSRRRFLIRSAEVGLGLTAAGHKDCLLAHLTPRSLSGRRMAVGFTLALRNLPEFGRFQRGAELRLA